jgi:histidinol-phosphate aminotransferase
MSPEEVISFVRPSVRAEHAYRVGLDEHISVKLNQNENPFDIPSELKQEIIEKFCATSWNRYTNDQPFEVQAALAEYLNYDMDGILVSNGSNEMMATLGNIFIPSGAKVVLPRPLFSLYEKIARVEGAEIISVPALPDLSHDAEGLLEAVEHHRPVMTVLGSPNNPTGRSMSKEDMRRIVEASSGIVLIDEAYIDFVDDGRGLLDWISEYPNILIVRTFSKAFGMAGLRLGYLLGHPAVMSEILKARIPFMVDRLAELTGCTMLKQKTLVQNRVALIKSETQHMYTALANMEQYLSVVPTTANFMIFKPNMNSKTLIKEMSLAGILLRDMNGYPELQNYVRVSAGTPEENVLFLQMLQQVLEKNSG